MIIRELVTKLSFNVDRKGIESFNRSIIGFKTKFALASTAAVGFVTSIVKTVSAISDSILDINELARSTKIATSDLVSLQKAAEQFRISPEQFETAFRRLNDLRNDAEEGFGELFKIATDQKIEFRNVNGTVKDTIELFNILIEHLSKIDDESERLRIAQNIFGLQRFGDLAKDGIESFKELSKSFKPFGDELEKAEKKAINFDKSWTTLKQNFKETAFNVLSPLIDFTGGFFKEINNITEAVKKGEFRKFAELGATGYQEFLENEKKTQSQFSSPEASNRRVDINTKIEIQPPAGSEETQRKFFQDAASEAFTNNFNNEIKKIANNFPETE